MTTMSSNDRMHMYWGKQRFINNLNTALTDPVLVPNIREAAYEVYSKQISEDTVNYLEFLVVTFVSGAVSVRAVTGNSNNANYEELGKLLNGGYYDEVDFYNSVRANYTVVNLEA